MVRTARLHRAGTGPIPVWATLLFINLKMVTSNKVYKVAIYPTFHES